MASWWDVPTLSASLHSKSCEKRTRFSQLFLWYVIRVYEEQTGIELAGIELAGAEVRCTA